VITEVGDISVDDNLSPEVVLCHTVYMCDCICTTVHGHDGV